MEPTTPPAVMPLTQIVREDMKNAMRAKDAATLECVRGLMSSFTNELVTLKRMPSDSLSDSEALAVIKRAVKKGKDAAQQFIDGGRPELAEKENAEVAILSKYLPVQASEAEIEAVAKEKIAEAGAVDKAGAGKLIGAISKHFAGNADGMLVKQVVERLLA
jgi:hypothetical protein